ncbi:MAG: pilus assembly FimT family protein [Candidatus Marinarcus sp.]|uniref:pilus assembly FimT family protein n=1 Tax=Candidatus Marinarcus sp. TaxID=3100987 RepID=UPI003AFFE4F3
MKSVPPKSFTLLEMILVVVILSIVYAAFIPKMSTEKNRLNLAAQRIVLYLNQTRYQAMIDDMFDPHDNLWHKKRWTLKFLHCSDEKDGIYYSIYSDKNRTGQINKDECLKDPLTNKYVYSHNDCKLTKDRSRFVFLTREFGITNVNVSCNKTTTIGQLSFGYDGKLYSKLSADENDPFNYLVTKSCEISLSNSKNETEIITIEPITGYIHIKSNEK